METHETDNRPRASGRDIRRHVLSSASPSVQLGQLGQRQVGDDGSVY